MDTKRLCKKTSTLLFCLCSLCPMCFKTPMFFYVSNPFQFRILFTIFFVECYINAFFCILKNKYTYFFYIINFIVYHVHRVCLLNTIVDLFLLYCNMSQIVSYKRYRGAEQNISIILHKILCLM